MCDIETGSCLLPSQWCRKLLPGRRGNSWRTQVCESKWIPLCCCCCCCFFFSSCLFHICIWIYVVFSHLSLVTIFLLNLSAVSPSDVIFPFCLFVDALTLPFRKPRSCLTRKSLYLWTRRRSWSFLLNWSWVRCSCVCSITSPSAARRMILSTHSVHSWWQKRRTRRRLPFVGRGWAGCLLPVWRSWSSWRPGTLKLHWSWETPR